MVAVENHHGASQVDPPMENVPVPMVPAPQPAQSNRHEAPGEFAGKSSSYAFILPWLYLFYSSQREFINDLVAARERTWPYRTEKSDVQHFFRVIWRDPIRNTSDPICLRVRKNGTLLTIRL